MRLMPETAMLAAPTFRSRAYLQAMAATGIAPAMVLLLEGTEPAWTGPEEVEVPLWQGKRMRFRPGEPLAASLERLGMPVRRLAGSDVNAPTVVQAVADLQTATVIYSGQGGALLRPPILSAGKRFLHVHGGWIPQYRGSTTFYYQILRNGHMGVSALWLDQQIDEGPVLARRSFRPAKGIDIDRIQDPVSRAGLLVELLAAGDLPQGQRPDEPGETFQVIHPVLKHLALRRLGLARSD